MISDDDEYGNARYHGYCVSLMRELAGMIGFNYTIQIVKDAKYGAYNTYDGTWNGMIGEIMRNVNFTICRFQINIE